MSVASFWARYNEARGLFDTERQQATTILLSLADESLPHELHIRTRILLASATSDLDTRGEYLNYAERMCVAFSAAYGSESLEYATICELSSDLLDERDLLSGSRLDEMYAAIAVDWRVSELPSPNRPSSSQPIAPVTTSAAATASTPGATIRKAQDSLDPLRTFDLLVPARVVQDGRTVQGYVVGRFEVMGRIWKIMTNVSLSGRRVDADGQISNQDDLPMVYAVRTRRRLGRSTSYYEDVVPLASVV